MASVLRTKWASGPPEPDHLADAARSSSVPVAAPLMVKRLAGPAGATARSGFGAATSDAGATSGAAEGATSGAADGAATSGAAAGAASGDGAEVGVGAATSDAGGLGEPGAGCEHHGKEGRRKNCDAHHRDVPRFSRPIKRAEPPLLAREGFMMPARRACSVAASAMR